MMRTTILSLVLILFSLTLALGQKGQIIKNQTLTSSVLNQDVYSNIYLPAGYDETKTYPVIYYLHVFGGEHHSSMGFMETMDAWIHEKKFPETIIVPPDGKKSWYMDDYAGNFKTQKMVHPVV